MIPAYREQNGEVRCYYLRGGHICFHLALLYLFGHGCSRPHDFSFSVSHLETIFLIGNVEGDIILIIYDDFSIANITYLCKFQRKILTKISIRLNSDQFQGLLEINREK